MDRETGGNPSPDAAQDKAPEPGLDTAPPDLPPVERLPIDDAALDGESQDLLDADGADARDARLDAERVDGVPGEDRPADGAPHDASSSDQVGADGPGVDASSVCGPCMEQWICGSSGPTVEVNLAPMDDGCHLSGLSGNKLLQPDGTITEGGVVVGSIMRAGARVRVSYPDGGQWLYCSAPPACTPWP